MLKKLSFIAALMLVLPLTSCSDSSDDLSLGTVTGTWLVTSGTVEEDGVVTDLEVEKGDEKKFPRTELNLSAANILTGNGVYTAGPLSFVVKGKNISVILGESEEDFDVEIVSLKNNECVAKGVVQEGGDTGTYIFHLKKIK